ncbi:unnamed protein product, partial [Rotaria sp. Silwood2]
PVFVGDRLLFYALLDETMSFDHTITVELFTGIQQQPISLARVDHVPSVLGSQLVMHLAAKALLRELSDDQKTIDKELLVNISIKYGILCPYTAFICVERRLDANSESNVDMELREVPIMIIPKKHTTRFANHSVSKPVTSSTSVDIYKSLHNSSTSSNQTSKMIWPTDEQKLVDRFIELQQYDGLWILTPDDVNQLTGKSFTTFSSSMVEKLEKNAQQSIITTAIVIILLETRYLALKTLW